MPTAVRAIRVVRATSLQKLQELQELPIVSRILDYLMQPETAVVFDVDGVLATYEFGDLSHAACLQGDWQRYVEQMRPYDHAKPIDQLRDFIAAKGPELVFACSVAQEYERAQKTDFVVRSYAIEKDHVYMVGSQEEKIAALQQLSCTLACERARIALVEDSVAVLDRAACFGFTTVHISSFFAWKTT